MLGIRPADAARPTQPPSLPARTTVPPVRRRRSHRARGPQSRPPCLPRHGPRGGTLRPGNPPAPNPARHSASPPREATRPQGRSARRERGSFRPRPPPPTFLRKPTRRHRLRRHGPAAHRSGCARGQRERQPSCGAVPRRRRRPPRPSFRRKAVHRGRAASGGCS